MVAQIDKQNKGKNCTYLHSKFTLKFKNVTKHLNYNAENY